MNDAEPGDAQPADARPGAQGLVAELWYAAAPDLDDPLLLDALRIVSADVQWQGGALVVPHGGPVDAPGGGAVNTPAGGAVGRW